VKVWNSQMIEDRAFAGDVRFNTDTQMIEIYTADKWIVLNDNGMYTARTKNYKIDKKVKEKALNELFGVK